MMYRGGGDVTTAQHMLHTAHMYLMVSGVTTANNVTPQLGRGGGGGGASCFSAPKE